MCAMRITNHIYDNYSSSMRSREYVRKRIFILYIYIKKGVFGIHFHTYLRQFDLMLKIYAFGNPTFHSLSIPKINFRNPQNSYLLIF
jgi:hypothetical protein